MYEASIGAEFLEGEKSAVFRHTFDDMADPVPALPPKPQPKKPSKKPGVVQVIDTMRYTHNATAEPRQTTCCKFSIGKNKCKLSGTSPTSCTIPSGSQL